MAYVLPEDDEEKKLQGQGAPGTSAMLGGAAAPGAAAQAPSASPQQPSTSYTSWDRILSANEDAAKASASNLAGRVQQNAQGIKDKATAAGASFQDAVTAGTPAAARAPVVGGARVAIGGQAATGGQAAPAINAFNQPTQAPLPVISASTTPSPTAPPKQGVGGPTARPQALMDAVSLAPPPPPPPQPPAAPPGPTQGGGVHTTMPSDILRASQANSGSQGGPIEVVRDGLKTNLTPEQARARAAEQYAGPESLSEYNKSWGDILSGGRDAVGQVNLTKQRDEYGRLRGDSGIEALLQDGAQGPYTRGGSQRDAALLGSAGRGRFNDLQKNWGGLLGDLNGQETKAGAQVADAKKRTADDAAETQAQLGKYERSQAEAKILADKAAIKHKAAIKTNDQLLKERDGLDMDADTDDWIDKIREQAMQDGSNMFYQNNGDNPAYRAFRKGEKSGDWGEFTDWLEKKRGPGAGGEFLNAWNDTKNRQARRAQWEMDAADAGWNNGQEKLSFAERQALQTMVKMINEGGNGQVTDGYIPAYMDSKKSLYQRKKYRQ